MIVRRLMFSLIAVAAMVIMPSCESIEPEGKQAPFKWKTDVEVLNGVVSVPHYGGTYTFTCTNYGDSFWLYGAEAMSDGTTVWYEHDDGDYRHVKTPWMEASVSNGDLVVTIQPNESGVERTVKVNLECYNAFDDFTFKQAAAE